VSTFFVWRSFHGMRIGTLAAEAAKVPPRELAGDAQFQASEFRAEKQEPSLKPSSRS
jgi:hypothetical protein